MKKLLLFLIFALFIFGCSENQKKENTKQLSELQIAACEKADEAGTCSSRLSEIGIVLKEDCCKILGKCC